MSDSAYSARIEQLLASSAVTTTHTGGRRVPFVCGSLLRQLKLQAIGEPTRDEIRAKIAGLEDQSFRGWLLSRGSNPIQAEINNLTAELEQLTASADAAALLNSGVLSRPVTMLVNPAELRIAQPKRKVEFKTHAGSRFLHFLDSQNRNNDLMRITLSGSTGVMHTHPDIPRDSIEAQAAANRYKQWMSFYTLINEPMLIEDTSSGVSLQRPNEFSLICPSPHLPVPIAFLGHWDAMPEIRVSAEHAHSLEYSVTFIVDSVTPSLTSVLTGLGL